MSCSCDRDGAPAVTVPIARVRESWAITPEGRAALLSDPAADLPDAEPWPQLDDLDFLDPEDADPGPPFDAEYAEVLRLAFGHLADNDVPVGAEAETSPWYAGGRYVAD